MHRRRLILDMDILTMSEVETPGTLHIYTDCETPATFDPEKLAKWQKHLGRINKRIKKGEK